MNNLDTLIAKLTRIDSYITTDILATWRKLGGRDKWKAIDKLAFATAITASEDQLEMVQVDEPTKKKRAAIASKREALKLIRRGLETC